MDLTAGPHELPRVHGPQDGNHWLTSLKLLRNDRAEWTSHESTLFKLVPELIDFMLWARHTENALMVHTLDRKSHHRHNSVNTLNIIHTNCWCQWAQLTGALSSLHDDDLTKPDSGRPRKKNPWHKKWIWLLNHSAHKSLENTRIRSKGKKEFISTIINLKLPVVRLHSPYKLIIRMQLRTINGICSPVACNTEKKQS